MKDYRIKATENGQTFYSANVYTRLEAFAKCDDLDRRYPINGSRQPVHVTEVPAGWDFVNQCAAAKERK